MLMVACANKNIGVMTYDQAVLTYGPPDKERFVDVQRVAVWNRGETTQKNKFAGENRYDMTYNQVIRVFDEKGILRSERYQ